MESLFSLRGYYKFLRINNRKNLYSCIYPKACLMYSMYFLFIASICLSAGATPAGSCKGSNNSCRKILWEYNKIYGIAVLVPIFNIFFGLTRCYYFKYPVKKGGLYDEPETLQRVLNLNVPELNEYFR